VVNVPKLLTTWAKIPSPAGRSSVRGGTDAGLAVTRSHPAHETLCRPNSGKCVGRGFPQRNEFGARALAQRRLSSPPTGSVVPDPINAAISAKTLQVPARLF
jgi:hypothetical protein